MSVVDMPPAIDGTATGKVYLIQYDEELWLSFTEEHKQFCKDTWLKKAEPIDGVRFVVLRLLPDDLFPMHGHEKPYVVWQQAIEGKPEQRTRVSFDQLKRKYFEYKAQMKECIPDTDELIDYVARYVGDL